MRKPGINKIIFLFIIVLGLIFAVFQNCAQNSQSTEEASTTCAFENEETWDITLASKNIKAGDTVVFKIQKSNLIQKADVDFGDGSDSKEVVPKAGKSVTAVNHVYNQAGQFSATFNLVDQCDMELPVSIDVVVGNGPAPSATPSATPTPTPTASPSPTPPSCASKNMACGSSIKCCKGLQCTGRYCKPQVTGISPPGRRF